MKCTSCYMLNTEDDTHCYRCGGRLEACNGNPDGWGKGGKGTPGWAYLFVVICGAIPVLALGGCVPIFIGFGGASTCLTISRATSVPLVLRVFGCMAISFGSWVLFGMLILAVADLQAS